MRRHARADHRWARPQFIKSFPVSLALKDAGIEEQTLHTGQHFDNSMSQVFFNELSLPSPTVQLDINRATHGHMTAKMLSAIEDQLTNDPVDAVVVYGDTNSTLAGALAAAKLRIPVVHIEAGLRSFNRQMPEEVNRVLTDHASTLLLCPTQASIKNLEREGIGAGVHHVGDVMFDATQLAIPLAQAHSTIVNDLGLSEASYHVATVHRASNTDTKPALEKTLSYIQSAAGDAPVVFPVHPRTRQAAQRFGLSLNDGTLRPVEPLGYLDMCQLLSNAKQLMTDSGGLQKEAYFHQVPCITLRDESEWTETIEAGWNRLWTSDDWTPRKTIGDYGKGTPPNVAPKRFLRSVAPTPKVHA